MAANTQRNAVSDYQERLNRFQDTDRERTEVISVCHDTLKTFVIALWLTNQQQLIESLGELRNECQIKSNDLERERVACRMLQEQNRELQALKVSRHLDGINIGFCWLNINLRIGEVLWWSSSMLTPMIIL